MAAEVILPEEEEVEKRKQKELEAYKRLGKVLRPKEEERS